jgi:hypothetical protein
MASDNAKARVMVEIAKYHHACAETLYSSICGRMRIRMG